MELEPWRFRPRSIYYASGFGLRYPTPIGPLRVDLGFVLNADDEVDRVRLHLGVGHAF